MANFNLDVNAPYPIPPEDTLEETHEDVSRQDVRFKHYGKKHWSS